MTLTTDGSDPVTGVEVDQSIADAVASPDAPGRPGPITEVLHAMSDPMRLAVVRQLARCEERTCGTFDLPISKSTLTHHLRILRQAGLVAERGEGARKYMRLRRAEVESAYPGLLDSILGAVGPDDEV